MNINPNDPAFPIPVGYRDAHGNYYGCESLGLTKLEIFTLAAMQGICSLSEYHSPHVKHSDLGFDAVQIDKATLAALEQEQEKGRE